MLSTADRFLAGVTTSIIFIFSGARPQEFNQSINEHTIAILLLDKIILLAIKCLTTCGY
jgi:hypothetical protein